MVVVDVGRVIVDVLDVLERAHEAIGTPTGTTTTLRTNR